MMGDQKLLEIIEDADGIWGVVIKKIGDDAAFEHNADLEFPAASVGKIPIALYAFHLVQDGMADLSQRFEIGKGDSLPGTGILQFLAPGIKLTLEDLIKLMLILSDNTAAKFLGSSYGPENINVHLESLGLEKTRLGIHGKTFDYGVTTPREVTALLEGIYTCKFLNEIYSKKLLDSMKNCENQLGIRRYLPRRDSLDRKLEIANKGGALDGVRHDAGIVFAKEPYVISVLSKNIQDTSYRPDNAGVLTIARLSEETYKQLS